MGGPREENKMGKWGATSYIIGNIVGSGIFISPTSILNNTQSVGLSLLVWLLSAAIATLGAYCYVELGTSIRRSGGDFAYLSFVNWRAIAFTFMCIGCVLIYPLMMAIQAESFGEYTVQLFISLGWFDAHALHSVHYTILRKLIAFATVWLLLCLNLFSLRTFGARFQIATTLAKILATALIVLIGAYWLVFHGAQNLSQPFSNSTFEPAQLTNAFFAGLFSYDGWDVLNFGAEEVQNPKSTMLFAILVGMGCVTAIYASINLSYFVVLSIPEMLSSNAVAMTFASRTMGCLAQVMPLVLNLVMLGAMNGTMFVASRYLFAAARERQLPSFIACINRRHDSPRAALFVHVLLAFLFSFLGDTEALINYLSFAEWLQRGFTMCALLYMRYAHLPVHPEAIRVPLVLPLVFLSICFTLVAVTLLRVFDTAFIGLVVLGVALAVYLALVWEAALPRFGVYRTVASWLNNLFASAVQIALDGEVDIALSGGEDAETALAPEKPKCQERGDKERPLERRRRTAEGDRK